MDNIIILDPILKERFEKFKKECMAQKVNKPDNVGWDEVAFIRMLVVAENYLVKGYNLVHDEA